MHHYFGSIAIDRWISFLIGRLRMVQHHQAASGRTHQHLRDPPAGKSGHDLRPKKNHGHCWWNKSCTSWYGKYPIYLRGLIHVRWCRISSINSMFHHQKLLGSKDTACDSELHTNIDPWFRNPANGAQPGRWLEMMEMHWTIKVMLCTCKYIIL